MCVSMWHFVCRVNYVSILLSFPINFNRRWQRKGNCQWTGRLKLSSRNVTFLSPCLTGEAVDVSSNFLSRAVVVFFTINILSYFRGTVSLRWQVTGNMWIVCIVLVTDIRITNDYFSSPTAFTSYQTTK